MAKAATLYRKNCARKHHAQGSVASAQVRRENSVSASGLGGEMRTADPANPDSSFGSPKFYILG